jgi:hypothetical protein
MDAREVSLRVDRLVRAAADAASLRMASTLWRRRWEPDVARIGLPDRAIDGPLGFLNPERVATATRADPAAVPAVVARAERSLRRQVQFFGYPSVQLAERPDFNLDPFTGRRWPDEYGKFIDYRRAEVGDPKWIWELNRCQELPLLCLVWRITGDARFAEGARDRLLTWVNQSAPGRGIAWANGFEAGLRGISFALAFDALRGSGLLTERDSGLVIRSLWQHGRWALRDHSFGSSANNHLVGEAAGLTTIGLLAPELKEAGSWVDRGLEWLERESDRQVLGDGSGAEQAFAYHLFVCDLLMLVAALLRSRGTPVPTSVSSALERSADALALQVQDGEPDLAYGDSDDGRVFIFDAEEIRTAAAVRTTLGSAVGVARRRDGSTDLTSMLLFGDTRDPDEPEGRDSGESGLLGDSGLIVLRRDGVRVTFDTGPLGYLRIAAHGHADALQVTLSEGAQDILSDPGTGTYFGDVKLRRALRSTAAHSTVSVDGLDQAVYGGPFLWLQHPGTRLTHLDLGAGIAVGEVDAWTRLPDPVRHRRAITMLPGGVLLVYDRLDARASHTYAQTWPLHPSLDVRERGPALFEAFAGDRSYLLAAFAPPSRIVVLRGEDGMSEGRWSRRLERVESTSVIRAEREEAGRVEFAALMIPTHGSALDDPGLELARAGSRAIVTFMIERQWQVQFDLDDPETPVRIDGGA